MSFDFTLLTQKLTKALEHVATDIGTLKTGRASVQMLDGVMVEAYGAYMKLVEVASISAPDPTLLVISPWDKSLLAAIEKAVATSDLNLHPVIDKDILRIAIAPLTEEKRKEMVKRLHQKIESGRVLLRNVRTEIKKEIEDQENKADVSEDDIKQDLETMEKMIKEASVKLDEMSAQKEKELLTL